MTTTDWELYVDDNVLVADFGAGMPSDEAEFAKVNEQFEELAARSGVDAHVSVLQMEASLNSGVFEKAKEAANVGATYGIDRWAIVSDDIKNLALKSKVADMGVETMTTDDRSEAVDWAKA